MKLLIVLICALFLFGCGNAFVRVISALEEHNVSSCFCPALAVGGGFGLGINHSFKGVTATGGTEVEACIEYCRTR
jgi:hypothetical protein